MKLEFDYSITFQTGAQIFQWQRIEILSEYNDRLEELVMECLRCHRNVNIMHEKHNIIYISMKCIRSDDFPVPPFRYELKRYEQGLKAGCFLTYRNSEDGTYHWEQD